ncbi:MAG: PilZ domain-containing protein [Myxococcota bacterium]
MADRDPELMPTASPEGTGEIRAGDLGEGAHYKARRQHDRWSLHADVSLGRVQGVVLNASAGGLRVAVDERLPEGLFELLVTTETTARRKRAELVWQRRLRDGWLCGVRFPDPSPSFMSADRFADAA